MVRETRTKAEDIYSTGTLSYKGSFYLPKINNEKAISISMFNKYMIAVYKHTIACYKMKVEE